MAKKRPDPEPRSHPPFGPLLDVPAAAAYLNTRESHIKELISSRRIPHYKVGRYIRFSPDDLDAWLRENHRDRR